MHKANLTISPEGAKALARLEHLRQKSFELTTQLLDAINYVQQSLGRDIAAPTEDEEDQLEALEYCIEDCLIDAETYQNSIEGRYEWLFNLLSLPPAEPRS